MNDPLPDHLARYEALLEDYPDFVRALATPLPQSIALNPCRASSQDLAGLLGNDLQLSPLPWRDDAFRLHAEDRPGRHWGFTAGLYSVQEEASLLPVTLLDPQPGERVLDLCAAPGNKSAHIAIAVGQAGTVIANDVKAGRLTAVHDLIRRLGLLNVATTARDGATWPLQAGSFDRVLVDAPCTAEGKAQRGVRRGATRAFRSWIARVQRDLLRRALTVVRPGGRVVYSTCTFGPEENELVVADVLEEVGHAFDVRIVEPITRPPGADPGLSQYRGHALPADLRHAVRMWPHRTQTGGFFAVAIERGEDPGNTASPELAPLPRPAPPELVRELIEPWGVAPGVIEPLHFFLDARHLRAMGQAMQLPANIAPQSLGFDFARLGSRQLKPSAAGAMWLGPHAHERILDLDDSQLLRWRAREDIPFPSDRLDQGNVLVRYRGITLGTAFVRGGAHCVLESHCPRAWSTTQ